jgi:hypothetical protein
MEPITHLSWHLTDYPSLYPDAITKESVRKEWDEIISKLIDINIRKKLGGNMGMHRPNDVEVFGNGISLRSA